MNILRGLIKRRHRQPEPTREVQAQPVIPQSTQVRRTASPPPVAAENAQTNYLLSSPWTVTSDHIPRMPEFKVLSSRPCSVCAPKSQLMRKTDKFTFTSEFMELMQVASSKRYCYTRPAKDPHQPDQYYRHLHGAQHGSRKIIWMLSILALLRRHGDKTAQEFPEEYLQAVIVANMLNGSGRQNDRGVEPPEDKATSAEHAYSMLLNLNICPKLAAICRDAIIYKDASDPGKTKPNPFMERYGDNPNAVMLFNLLHDSHLLDFARVSKGQFDLSYMAYYHAAEGQPELRHDLQRLQLKVFEALEGQQDIFDTCKVVNPDTGEKVTFSANRNDQAKKPLEFAGNTLYAQYRWFCQHQPETAKMVEEVARFNPVRPVFNSSHLVQTSCPKGLGSHSRLEGTYQQPGTGQKFYLKQPDTADDARNEKLALSLASLMELQTPKMEWVGRRSETPMLVSEWMDNLVRADTKTRRLKILQQASSRQRARLLLVNCLLGNGDCISDRIDNSFKLEDGSVATLDWGVSCQRPFFRLIWPTPQNSINLERRLSSAMPEYIYQLNHQHSSLTNIMLRRRMNSLSSTPMVFEGINEADLNEEAERLLNIPEESFNHLIELYGPDKPAERLWLRQVLHERRAWLALYHPKACQKQVVTPAEQAAINASGSRGFCLPCSNKDIEQGEIRVLQKTRADGTPVTQLQLRLTPEAAQSLEEHLGYGLDITLINDRIHWLNSLRTKKLPDDKRKELQADIKQFIVQCETCQQKMESEKSRWQKPEAAKLDQCMRQLDECTSQASNVLKAVSDPSPATASLVFAKIPDITLLPPGLPPRVSSIATDNRSSFSYHQGTPHHNRMQLEAGKTEVTLFSYDNTSSIRNLTCSLSATQEGSPDIDLTYFPAAQPSARSLSRVVTLETPGHDSDTTRSLVQTLNNLGLDTHRPSHVELQADYLVQLANASGVLHQMHASPEVCDHYTRWQANKTDDALLLSLNQAREAYLCQHLKLDPKEGIHWGMHTTFEAGCRVYYAPPYPFGMNPDSHEKDFRLIHQLGYRSSREAVPTLKQLIHSGGALMPLWQRDLMGMPHFGSKAVNTNLKNGSGTMVYSTLQPSTSPPTGLALELNPQLLHRLDVQIVEETGFGIIEDFDVTSPESLRQMCSHDKSRAGLNSFISVGTTNWQVDFLKPVPLAEHMMSLSTPGGEIEEEARQFMSSQFDLWPSGKTVQSHFQAPGYTSDLAVTDQDKKHYAKLTGVLSPLSKAHKELLKQLGVEHLPALKRHNPNLLNGTLETLDGLIVKDTSLTGIDLKGLQMGNSRWEKVTFMRCHWEGTELVQCLLQQCTIEPCLFPKTIAPGTLKSCTLKPVVESEIQQWLVNMEQLCTVQTFHPTSFEAVEMVCNQGTTVARAWFKALIQKYPDFNYASPELFSALPNPLKQIYLNGIDSLWPPAFQPVLKNVSVYEMPRLLKQNPDLRQGQRLILDNLKLPTGMNFSRVDCTKITARHAWLGKAIFDPDKPLPDLFAADLTGTRVSWAACPALRKIIEKHPQWGEYEGAPPAADQARALLACPEPKPDDIAQLLMSCLIQNSICEFPSELLNKIDHPDFYLMILLLPAIAGIYTLRLASLRQTVFSHLSNPACKTWRTDIQEQAVTALTELKDWIRHDEPVKEALKHMAGLPEYWDSINRLRNCLSPEQFVWINNLDRASLKQCIDQNPDIFNGRLSNLDNLTFKPAADFSHAQCQGISARKANLEDALFPATGPLPDLVGAHLEDSPFWWAAYEPFAAFKREHQDWVLNGRMSQEEVNNFKKKNYQQLAPYEAASLLLSHINRNHDVCVYSVFQNHSSATLIRCFVRVFVLMDASGPMSGYAFGCLMRIKNIALKTMKAMESSRDLLTQEKITLIQNAQSDYNEVNLKIKFEPGDCYFQERWEVAGNELKDLEQTLQTELKQEKKQQLLHYVKSRALVSTLCHFPLAVLEEYSGDQPETLLLNPERLTQYPEVCQPVIDWLCAEVAPYPLNTLLQNLLNPEQLISVIRNNPNFPEYCYNFNHIRFKPEAFLFEDLSQCSFIDADLPGVRLDPDRLPAFDQFSGANLAGSNCWLGSQSFYNNCPVLVEQLQRVCKSLPRVCTHKFEVEHLQEKAKTFFSPRNQEKILKLLLTQLWLGEDTYISSQYLGHFTDPDFLIAVCLMVSLADQPLKDPQQRPDSLQLLNLVRPAIAKLSSLPIPAAQRIPLLHLIQTQYQQHSRPNDSDWEQIGHSIQRAIHIEQSLEAVTPASLQAAARLLPQDEFLALRDANSLTRGLLQAKILTDRPELCRAVCNWLVSDGLQERGKTRLLQELASPEQLVTLVGNNPGLPDKLTDLSHIRFRPGIDLTDVDCSDLCFQNASLPDALFNNNFLPPMNQFEGATLTGSNLWAGVGSYLHACPQLLASLGERSDITLPLAPLTLQDTNQLLARAQQAEPPPGTGELMVLLLNMIWHGLASSELVSCFELSQDPDLLAISSQFMLLIGVTNKDGLPVELFQFGAIMLSAIRRLPDATDIPARRRLELLADTRQLYDLLFNKQLPDDSKIYFWNLIDEALTKTTRAIEEQAQLEREKERAEIREKERAEILAVITPQSLHDILSTLPLEDLRRCHSETPAKVLFNVSFLQENTPLCQPLCQWLATEGRTDTEKWRLFAALYDPEQLLIIVKNNPALPEQVTDFSNVQFLHRSDFTSIDCRGLIFHNAQLEGANFSPELLSGPEQFTDAKTKDSNIWAGSQIFYQGNALFLDKLSALTKGVLPVAPIADSEKAMAQLDDPESTPDPSRLPHLILTRLWQDRDPGPVLSNCCQPQHEQLLDCFSHSFLLVGHNTLPKGSLKEYSTCQLAQKATTNLVNLPLPLQQKQEHVQALITALQGMEPPLSEELKKHSVFLQETRQQLEQAIQAKEKDAHCEQLLETVTPASLQTAARLLPQDEFLALRDANSLTRGLLQAKILTDRPELCRAVCNWLVSDGLQERGKTRLLQELASPEQLVTLVGNNPGLPDKLTDLSHIRFRPGIDLTDVDCSDLCFQNASLPDALFNNNFLPPMNQFEGATLTGSNLWAGVGSYLHACPQLLASLGERSDITLPLAPLTLQDTNQLLARAQQAEPPPGTGELMVLLLNMIWHGLGTSELESCFKLSQDPDLLAISSQLMLLIGVTNKNGRPVELFQFAAIMVSAIQRLADATDIPDQHKIKLLADTRQLYDLLFNKQRPDDSEIYFWNQIDQALTKTTRTIERKREREQAALAQQQAILEQKRLEAERQRERSMIIANIATPAFEQLAQQLSLEALRRAQATSMMAVILDTELLQQQPALCQPVCQLLAGDSSPVTADKRQLFSMLDNSTELIRVIQQNSQLPEQLSNLNNVKFVDGADLREVNCSDISFQQARLQGARFNPACLPQVEQLTGARLADSNLWLGTQCFWQQSTQLQKLFKDHPHWQPLCALPEEMMKAPDSSWNTQTCIHFLLTSLWLEQPVPVGQWLASIENPTVLDIACQALPLLGAQGQTAPIGLERVVPLINTVMNQLETSDTLPLKVKLSITGQALELSQQQPDYENHNWAQLKLRIQTLHLQLNQEYQKQLSEARRSYRIDIRHWVPGTRLGPEDLAPLQHIQFITDNPDQPFSPEQLAVVQRDLEASFRAAGLPPVQGYLNYGLLQEGSPVTRIPEEYISELMKNLSGLQQVQLSFALPENLQQLWGPALPDDESFTVSTENLSTLCEWTFRSSAIPSLAQINIQNLPAAAKASFILDLYCHCPELARGQCHNREAVILELMRKHLSEVELVRPLFQQLCNHPLIPEGRRRIIASLDMEQHPEQFWALIVQNPDYHRGQVSNFDRLRFREGSDWCDFADDLTDLPAVELSGCSFRHAKLVGITLPYSLLTEDTAATVPLDGADCRHSDSLWWYADEDASPYRKLLGSARRWNPGSVKPHLRKATLLCKLIASVGYANHKKELEEALTREPSPGIPELKLMLISPAMATISRGEYQFGNPHYNITLATKALEYLETTEDPSLDISDLLALSLRKIRQALTASETDTPEVRRATTNALHRLFLQWFKTASYHAEQRRDAKVNDLVKSEAFVICKNQLLRPEKSE